MKVAHFIAVCAFALVTATSHAQYVKGNEAVRAMPDGTRQVETPPIPKDVLAKPCPAAQAGCAGSAWSMVETARRPARMHGDLRAPSNVPTLDLWR